MADTLFSHLALRFGTHPEDIATEALGYVLRSSTPARDALRDLLEGIGVRVASSLVYRNQAVADDNARPDLVGCDETGAQVLVIEAKFWAGLTDKQPVTYLARLPQGGGALLIVAPAARLTLLWGELLRRCDDARQPPQEQASSMPEARVADVAGHKLIALSWRALLDVVQVKLDAAGDRRCREDITQLRGLCDRMDSEAFLPMTSDEMTTQHYRRIVEFGAIVDDVVAVLVSRGVVSVKGLKATAGNGYYGRYFRIHGWGAFLACDVHNWMKHASTPLWLSVWGPNWTKTDRQVARKALADLESASSPRLFIRADGFPTIALTVQVGVERDTIVRSVVDQIATVAGLVPLVDEGEQPGGGDAGTPLPADTPSA